jgi:hypothetical protein
MKNNVLKNSVYGLLALFLFSVTSCDSDDDLPLGPTIVVNSFCYGPDASSSFFSVEAYNNRVVESGVNIFNTKAFIVDNGITEVNGELTGIGILISVDLFGDRNQNFQSGTYTIGDTELVGDAVISYFIDYDSSLMNNTGIVIESGNVIVTPYGSGYAIEIDGIDANGDRFHGIYLGEVYELN